MGLNSDSLSDEVCQEKTACLCSFKDIDSPPSFKISECNHRHHTNSETSNLLSVCSSHDSSTDNAESKVVVREYDASEGILMLSKVAVNQAAAEDQGLLGPKFLCGSRAFSNEHETPKVSECNGDDLSCISEDHRCAIDRKNVSCSPSSVNSSLMGGPEKKFGAQLTSYIQASSHCEVEEGRNCSCTPLKPTEESIHETELFSGKSYPSEVSSFRDIYTNARPLKGDLSECSRVQEEPLGAIAYAMDITESVKSKIDVDEEDPATLVKKHFDKNEDMVSAEVPNGQRPQEQYHIVKCSDESDALVDVKVCDICGDAGRDHLLATCSKCTDGAEHTYCMRVMLENVPEGNWMCEDCQLQEETEKQKQNYFQKEDEKQVRDKFQKVVRTPEVSSSNKICQNAGDSRTRLELDIRSPNAEKSGQVSSIAQTCAKRPAGNAESESIPKRRALETSVGSPRMSSPCRKTLISRDFPHKNLDNMKVKPNCQESTLGDHSYNGSQRNVRSPMISASNSPKTQMGVVMSRGFFTKSNSFNLSESKVKVDASSEVLKKKQFSHVTAAGDKEKHGIVKRICRTLSFDISTDQSNAADSKIKMLSPTMSFGKDSKSKRHTLAKEHNLSKRNFKAKVDRPTVISPMAGKQVGSDGESVFPCSAGAKCYPKPVPSHENCNISSKPTCLLAHGGSKHLNNDQAGSNVVKKQKLHSCLSKVVGDPSSLMKSYSLSGLKPNVATGKDHFRLNASTASRRCYHSYSDGRDILPQSQASCNQGGKGQKTSYFSSSREQHIAAGNGGGDSHKFNNINEAAESCPIMSHQASIHERGSSKETNQSSNKVYGPKSCNQTDTFSILAIPELNYIWRGGFKIKSDRRLPTFCTGIQAHLSACASPKVSEAVRKFPCEVLLEEVSCLRAWPSQFQENHPREDSIGVYFFAEDIVSYEGNYRSLIQCMIDYDLALKGDIDGIDLLIFSSNLLPEKSQRWNKLFFLWGVFKGRRISNEECMPSNKKKASIPGLNNACSDQALSIPRISGIQNMCASEQSRECSSVFKLFNNSLQSSGLVDSQEIPSVCPRREERDYGHQPSSDERKYSHLQVKIDQRLSTNDAITYCIPMQNQVCMDAHQTLATMKEYGPSKRSLEDYQPILQTGNYNLDYAIGSSGSSHSMMATNNSRATWGSPLSADPGQVDGKWEFKHCSEEQVLSSDCKECVESELLDLGLSLWAGKKPKKQALLPDFQLVADENNQLKHPPNSTAGLENDDGEDDKLSASVELSLTLPAYGKMKMPPNTKPFEL